MSIAQLDRTALQSSMGTQRFGQLHQHRERGLMERRLQPIVTYLGIALLGILATVLWPVATAGQDAPSLLPHASSQTPPHRQSLTALKPIPGVIPKIPSPQDWATERPSQESKNTYQTPPVYLEGSSSGVPSIVRPGSPSSYTEEILSTRLNVRAHSGTWGGIAYAPVTLDGYIAFVLAAPVAQPGLTGDPQPTPIQLRIDAVEDRLRDILKVADAETLVVDKGTAGDQTVLLASDRDDLWQTVVFALTDYDAQLYGVSREEIGATAIEGVYRLLLRSLQERSPEVMQQNTRLALQDLLVGLAISALLVLLQLRLGKRWRRLRREVRATPTMAVPPRTILTQAELEDNRLPRRPWRRARSHPKRLSRDLSLTVLLRQGLLAAQVIVWLLAVSSGLRRFPQTRQFGTWTIDTPFLLVGILIGTYAAVRIGQAVVGWCIQRWADEQAVLESESQRKLLRLPTFRAAFKGATAATIGAIGIVIALRVFDVPLGPILAGAGIISVAVSLGSQGTISDIVNGLIALSADSYAVGDWIEVNDAKGLVEHLNLFHVQIRSPEGELITIRHGAIDLVRNASKDWGRVNLTVEVGHSVEVNHALLAVKSVAIQLCQDPKWRDLILEEPKLLGVDRLASSGVTIRLWIKTLPLKHWQVGRELRRRLKHHFATEGIPIGMPQQSLWMRDYAEFQAAMANSAEKAGLWIETDRVGGPPMPAADEPAIDADVDGDG